MHDWRERIRLEGKLIAEEDVLRGVNIIRPLAASLEAQGLEHPTEFEVSTALAFWYFAENQPDIVLLEVGLGGAIDSTNVVHPEVVVLTSIGMDHMEYLGTTLKQITEVKAGIIKDTSPVVTSVQQDEALQVIRETCLERGAPLIRVIIRDNLPAEIAAGEMKAEGEGQLSSEAADDSKPAISAGATYSPVAVYAVPQPSRTPEHTGRFDYYGLDISIPGCEVSLAGRHQVHNAATALAAVEALLSKENSGPGPYSESLHQAVFHQAVFHRTVRQALLEVSWPGRMELVECVLDGKTVRILFDGAHNPEGAEALRQTLEQGFPRRRLVFCFGMLADKAVEQSLETLLPLGDAFVVTCPPSARAGNWRNIAALVQRAGCLCIEEENIARAVSAALDMCGEEDLLCVTGSLYMLAEARSYVLGLMQQEGQRSRTRPAR
jgi:dihydrofolate synthase/folylpolyglutamate synthase